MTPTAPHDARTRELVGRAALVAFCVAAAVLGYWVVVGTTPGFGTPPLVASALVLLASAAALAYGPVLVYEMMRSARRGRLYLLRWLYVIGLFLLLLWVYSVYDVERRVVSGGAPQYKRLSQLAESYFGAFAITQFLVLSVLTPAFVAGSIAEEKERKTLEFLLATDLNNREIVFGKLAARLGTLVLFVIAGLPILSIMQFFGGIDPGMLLATFAATGMTVLSLAAVSLFNSVSCRRARDAIVLTYVAAIGYMALTGLTAFLKAVLGFYGWLTWGSVDLGELFDAFHAGNPIFGFIAVMRAIDTNAPLADVLLSELRSYAIFHGLVVVGCVAWSVIRVRAVALAQAGGVVGGLRVKARKAIKRRAVGSTPMVWKEVWVEGNIRLGRLGRLMVLLLFVGGFAPVVLIAYALGANSVRGTSFDDFLTAIWSGVANHWKQFGEGINVWLRVMNAIIGTLMLLGVAARAAGSVGSERDRDTLVSLMTTTLSTQEILWAKWLGSLMSVRAFLWWLVPVWLVAIVAGGVNPAAAILAALCWLAPATFFAAWGVYCSVATATTLRATTWAVFGALFFGGMHWVCAGMCLYMPLAAMSSRGDELKWPMYLELGLTPPGVFAWAPFHELDQLDFSKEGLAPAFAVLGMALWVIAAGVLGSLAHEQFARLTHRVALVRAGPPGGKKP